MRVSKGLVLAVLALANLGAIGISVAAATGAAVHELIQKRRSFGVATLSIKAGDAVRFINGDPYAHNVYSRNPEGWFDLGIQEEGDGMSVVFDTAGNFDIRCRIHPKMRLVVSVR
jgi:plastocyanin